MQNYFGDTPNKNLIAFQDPKVRELINYILASILVENERINSPRSTYPLQIIRRYKSYNSLQEKVKDYSSRDDKDKPITDYLAFTIIPAEERSIFSAQGDPILQEMIEKREELRRFIISKNNFLNNNETMTFEQYSEQCIEIIEQLKNIFDDIRKKSNQEDYAINRTKHYDSLKDTLAEDLTTCETLLGIDKDMSLDDILSMTSIDINKLLKELEDNYHNAITMYQLKKSVINIFENSELLKGFGVSISTDASRTKEKRTPSSYASDFLGIDLSIRMNNGELLILPIECQIQSREQHRDGNSGFAIHSNMEGKEISLPPIPKKPIWNRVKQTKEQYVARSRENFATRKRFLSSIMHSTPEFAVAQISTDDPDNERVMILPDDLYNSFKKVSRLSKGHRGYKIFFQYFRELYKRREELLPSDSSLAAYVTLDDMPNLAGNYREYNKFFQELRDSLDETFAVAYKIEPKSSDIARTDIQTSLSHDEI